MAWAASLTATGCERGWRELVSLVRVVGVGVAGRGCRAGGDLQAVGGELAGDRDRDAPVRPAAGVFELALAGVEPALRFAGDVDDLGARARVWRRSSAFPTTGPAAVAVGGLDEQPAGTGGAGFGDQPEPALLAGGVL
jgi:hypothetical protein